MLLKYESNFVLGKVCLLESVSEGNYKILSSSDYRSFQKAKITLISLKIKNTMKIVKSMIVALVAMMCLPIALRAQGLATELDVEGKKTLPYPRATKAIPASAMEYDSVAGCFVVRDTIAPSRAGARDGAARTVVTRAAVAYTEDGVQYGYFGNQLSSDNMSEMKALLEPWKTEFKNLDIDGILTPASDGDETWYMQIVGVDNDDIDDADGVMRIYNDIGSTWDYKTISIDGTALRGYTHIKKIVFEDCASGSGNASPMSNV